MNNISTPWTVVVDVVVLNNCGYNNSTTRTKIYLNLSPHSVALLSLYRHPKPKVNNINIYLISLPETYWFLKCYQFITVSRMCLYILYYCTEYYDDLDRSRVYCLCYRNRQNYHRNIGIRIQFVVSTILYTNL